MKQAADSIACPATPPTPLHNAKRGPEEPTPDRASNNIIIAGIIVQTAVAMARVSAPRSGIARQLTPFRGRSA